MTKGIELVHNFLNYVLRHDVCPEHDAGVRAAQRVCGLAADELPRCLRATALLPGHFNVAARALFCTRPEDVAASFDNARGLGVRAALPAGFDAAAVFEVGILLGPDDTNTALALFEAYRGRADDGRPVGVVDTTLEDLELLRIVFPDAKRRRLYAGLKNPETGDTVAVEPVGVAYMRPCVVRDGWDRGYGSIAVADVDTDGDTDTARPASAAAAAAARSNEKGLPLIFNETILRELSPGMKLRAEIVTLDLDCGDSRLRFVKNVHQLFPSFYVFLPQELMLGFKEPAPNERPAPSVERPDIEEKVLERMFGEEVDMIDKAERAACDQGTKGQKGVGGELEI